jgi:hypothetical protein
MGLPLLCARNGIATETARKKKQHSVARNVAFRLAEWHICPGLKVMRTHQQPETIRGLQRGLQVMQVLQVSSIASLNDIYRATRISKPSLLRILKTLEHAGLVSRRLADGHYRFSSFTGAVRKRDAHERVAEAAAPVLDELCQKVKWPSDLLVPAGNHMERREAAAL